METKTKNEMIRSAVRSAMERRGLSGYRVAMECGVQQQPLRDWLSGKRGISYAGLCRVLEFLDLRVM